MAQNQMMMGGQMQYPGMGGSAPMAPNMAGAYQQQGQGVPNAGQQAGSSPVGGQQMQGGYNQQAAAMQQYQLLQQQHQQQLQQFWAVQMQEVEQANDFKNHQLPLARIKKIMKADEDVRMISAEAPVVFSKACEMFILELTLRSWIHTEENKRRTLQKNDIAGAITRTDIFDFLVDIVPRDDLKEGLDLNVARAQVTGMPGAEMAHNPYGGMYYSMPQPQAAPPPQQPGMMPASMMVGRPAVGMDPNSMYAQQRPNMGYMQAPMQWPGTPSHGGPTGSSN
eukprot:jgi/Mesen1/2095/ME000151S01358